MNGRIYSSSTILNIKDPINVFDINVILFTIILSKDRVDFKLIILESFSKNVSIILTFYMLTFVI